MAGWLSESTCFGIWTLSCCYGGWQLLLLIASAFTTHHNSGCYCCCSHAGQGIRDITLLLLLYMDDPVLPSPSQHQLKAALDILEECWWPISVGQRSWSSTRKGFHWRMGLSQQQIIQLGMGQQVLTVDQFCQPLHRDSDCLALGIKFEKSNTPNQLISSAEFFSRRIEPILFVKCGPRTVPMFKTCVVPGLTCAGTFESKGLVKGTLLPGPSTLAVNGGSGWESLGACRFA